MEDGLISMETTMTVMENLLMLPLTQNRSIQKTNTLITLTATMSMTSFKNNLEDLANTTLMIRKRPKAFIFQKSQLISKL